jgi:hypothetical protein
MARAEVEAADSDRACPPPLAGSHRVGRCGAIAVLAATVRNRQRGRRAVAAQAATAGAQPEQFGQRGGLDGASAPMATSSSTRHTSVALEPPPPEGPTDAPSTSAARSSRFSVSSFRSRSAAWWRWRATAAIVHGSGRRADAGTIGGRGSMSVTSRSPRTGQRSAERPNGPSACVLVVLVSRHLHIQDERRPVAGRANRLCGFTGR